MLVGITGGIAYAQDASGTTPAGGDVGPVYVDSTEIIYLESYPVQVQLLVKGSLPTPCHQPVFEVQDFGTSIAVDLWSLADPEQMCAQVLEPFELTIALGSWESANLPVLLNGEEIGRVQIGTAPTGPTLAGAGWSFGFCLGYCMADLVIAADELTVTGQDREATALLYVNRGTLTAEGRARLDAALAALDGVVLDPVYGCPDCTDGGAAYLDIARGGSVERVSMEFDSPPEVLAELYATSSSLIGALETCQSTDLVEVAADCVAYERS